MRLSGYAVGRDNNFNLIRLVAALSVIFSHSVAVLGLPPQREFFFDRLGLSLGEMAVDVFFVTSGFLVAGSLINRRNLVAFLWARALRIYPALWVMLALTVFVLAPALTSLPAENYFAAPETYAYFAKCATLARRRPLRAARRVRRGAAEGRIQRLAVDAADRAPNVPLPRSGMVRSHRRAGDTGTDAHARRADRRRHVSRDNRAGPPVWVAVQPGRHPSVHVPLRYDSIYLWRDKVPLSRGALYALLAILLSASVNKSAYFLAYVLCLAPLVLHLAYIPKGRVLAFNEWGDFSYGVYIYAFPIQQTLAFLFPETAAFRDGRAVRFADVDCRGVFLESGREARAGAQRAISPPQRRGPSPALFDGRRTPLFLPRRCRGAKFFQPGRKAFPN